MKTAIRLIASCFVVVAMLTQARAVEGADINVFCSNGLREVVVALVPKFEQMTGHKVVLLFEPSTRLKTRIDAGEPFDLAVLTTALVDEEVKAGKLGPDSRTLIARSGLGLSIRAGSKKPEIGTVDAFKRALLGAKSIGIATQGASAAPFEALVAKLGVTAQLTPKYTLRDTAAQVGEDVATGRVEIGVAPVSEILPVKGVDLIGAFPAEIQSWVEMTASVAVGAKEKGGARDLIAFLTSPANVAVITAKGMEPATAKAAGTRP